MHRDLKPGNVFLTESGEIKVLDLGLSAARPPTLTEKVVPDDRRLHWKISSSGARVVARNAPVVTGTPENAGDPSVGKVVAREGGKAQRLAPKSASAEFLTPPAHE